MSTPNVRATGKVPELVPPEEVFENASKHDGTFFPKPMILSTFWPRGGGGWGDLGEGVPGHQFEKNKKCKRKERQLYSFLCFGNMGHPLKNWRARWPAFIVVLWKRVIKMLRTAHADAVRVQTALAKHHARRRVSDVPSPHVPHHFDISQRIARMVR